MTALLDRFTVTTISRTVREIVVAYLAAYIAFGGAITGPSEWVVVAQIILAIKLHVFALPLAFTPVLDPVPLWAWYVISVMWLSKAVHLSGYTTGEIVAEIESAYASARSSASTHTISVFSPAVIIVSCLVVIVINLMFGKSTPMAVAGVALAAIAILLSSWSLIERGYGTNGGDL